MKRFYDIFCVFRFSNWHIAATLTAYAAVLYAHRCESGFRESHRSGAIPPAIPSSAWTGDAIYPLKIVNFQIYDILNERGKYHPEVEYFMLDYIDRDQCTHIRLPFLRQEQVFYVVGKLQEDIQNGHQISTLRITPEAFLNESYVNPLIANEAISVGVKDAEHLLSTTREVLFDYRYESLAKRFQGTKEQS